VLVWLAIIILVFAGIYWTQLSSLARWARHRAELADRLRVNVQLIDAQTRSHLWPSASTSPWPDLFDMQDEIVARLANQLGAQLIAAEARRAEAGAASRLDEGP